jgi:hypothetical protein
MSTCKQLTLAILLACAAPAYAQDADELARKLSNPVAAMISVPFQYNYDEAIGPAEGHRHLLNIQPVIPASIGEDWNLISRVIDVFGPSGSQSGLGDVVASFFFSPKAPTAGGVTWGIGPVFMLPTATDDLLGGEKWGAGPTAVVLKQSGPWTVGALVNHIESFAGSDTRGDVSATYFQPFLSRALGQGQTFGIGMESTYNWETEDWNGPVNLSYSKVTRWGNQMVSLAGGVRGYLETPGEGPDWGLRFTITLLYPR